MRYIRIRPDSSSGRVRISEYNERCNPGVMTSITSSALVICLVVHTCKATHSKHQSSPNMWQQLKDGLTFLKKLEVLECCSGVLCLVCFCSKPLRSGEKTLRAHCQYVLCFPMLKIRQTEHWVYYWEYCSVYAVKYCSVAPRTFWQYWKVNTDVQSLFIIYLF